MDVVLRGHSRSTMAYLGELEQHLRDSGGLGEPGSCRRTSWAVWTARLLSKPRQTTCRSTRTGPHRPHVPARHSVWRSRGRLLALCPEGLPQLPDAANGCRTRWRRRARRCAAPARTADRVCWCSEGTAGGLTLRPSTALSGCASWCGTCGSARCVRSSRPPSRGTSGHRARSRARRPCAARRPQRYPQLDDGGLGPRERRRTHAMRDLSGSVPAVRPDGGLLVSSYGQCAGPESGKVTGRALVDARKVSAPTFNPVTPGSPSATPPSVPPCGTARSEPVRTP